MVENRLTCSEKSVQIPRERGWEQGPPEQENQVKASDSKLHWLIYKPSVERDEHLDQCPWILMLPALHSPDEL